MSINRIVLSSNKEGTTDTHNSNTHRHYVGGGGDSGTKVHTMIPFLYKSRTIKLIDGDRSQYSGYHWGGRLWIETDSQKPGELRVFRI